MAFRLVLTAITGGINKRCSVRTQFGNFNLILTKICEFKHYNYTNKLRCRSGVCKLLKILVLEDVSENSISRLKSFHGEGKQ